MYFFYFDESGTRDTNVGSLEKPKPHLYVLLAVGMHEEQWLPFDTEISNLKLEYINEIGQRGFGALELSDCEVKSRWLRIPDERIKHSKFLSALSDFQITKLSDLYFSQLAKRKAIVIATVIDKRLLHPHFTPEILHKKAYEFVLERIQWHIKEYDPGQNSLIIMDDTNIQLNRAVAMQHATFLRIGNRNMKFTSIVENPFFTRSELSNGVQLADLLSYNVYRAFRNEDMMYSHFREMLPYFQREKSDKVMDGIVVWPENSPLFGIARKELVHYWASTPPKEGA